ncbi:MAG: trypsin-like peptidase domain-containing protein [Dehalococcoidia bacterium]
MQTNTRRYALILLVVALLGLAACGGGGDAKPTVTATPEPTPPALSDLVEQYKTSIVDIATTGPDGSGGGTGIVWETPTQVLTNAHVVLGAVTIKVNDPVTKGKQYPAVVVALSPCDDVALLRVDRAEGLTPARFGDSKKLTVGSPVVAVGFPATTATSGSGSGLVVTEGIVSRLATSFADSGQKDLVQHTAPINPGNSGGPLLNRMGEVIGLNSYSIRGRQAENYAISSAEALFVANKLKAGKNVDYIGLRVVTNDEDLAYEYDLPYIDGLAVLATSAGSPATKAKPYAIEAGDTVAYIDGQFIDNVGTYCDVLRSHKPGDTVEVQIGAYNTQNKAALFRTSVTIE